MGATFQIAVTADFFDGAGKLMYRDIGLSVLEREANIAWRPIAPHEPEIQPEQLAGANAALVLAPRVTVHSLEASAELLTIARFGVGYDSVDVAACTAADVVLLIAAGAVDRPMAEATIAWLLALTHHVRTKDRLVREGRWHDRNGYMGCELRDRTLGIVGFGGIGRALVQLLSGFGMNPPIAFDPYLDAATVARHGARKVELDELLKEADFVSIHCPLNDATRNLIGARQLALMKPTAYLLNTARGGIVEENALCAALAENRIAGAALDVFVGEPILQPHRFGQLDNVILAPHSIGWTDEMFRDIGRTALASVVDLARGRKPNRGVVNPEIFEKPSFQAKWRRLQLGG
ncbi:MAG: hydroxyacid dehydrogenase [Gemmataceae bacterium]|nr:hydroxyacid dehydrogenase [Gemmataceae bacterium]